MAGHRSEAQRRLSINHSGKVIIWNIDGNSPVVLMAEETHLKHRPVTKSLYPELEDLTTRPRVLLTQTNMCTQVDKQWICGHIGYYQIRWCDKALNGCKGTSAAHDIIQVAEKCDDCIRKDTLPPPLDMK